MIRTQSIACHKNNCLRYDFIYIPGRFIRINLMSKGYDKRYCDDFQNQLTWERIDGIWKSFRQAGNSIEGRIGKLNFKKVMNKIGTKNDKFLDKLFDRFKLDKYYELKAQKQEIDLQDLVVGFAALSRISFMDKVKFVF